MTSNVIAQRLGSMLLFHSKNESGAGSPYRAPPQARWQDIREFVAAASAC
jgi:hypothetical protein